jgi:glutathione S-transferase
MSGLDPEDAPYLQRQHDRIEHCLDWLETQSTSEGFAPGLFSIMDINLICALGNVDHHGSFEWRGRSRLEAIIDRYRLRPSVTLTAGE